MRGPRTVTRTAPRAPQNRSWGLNSFDVSQALAATLTLLRRTIIWEVPSWEGEGAWSGPGGWALSLGCVARASPWGSGDPRHQVSPQAFPPEAPPPEAASQRFVLPGWSGRLREGARGRAGAAGPEQRTRHSLPAPISPLACSTFKNS